MSYSDFSKKHLLKHGWTEGNGLGRQENGMTEPVKVKIRTDKTGIGHDAGAEFTTHWWDQVFNQTLQSISVESDKDGGISLRKVNMKDKIKKKEEKARKKKALYGNFIKASSIVDWSQVKEEDSSSASDNDMTTRLSEQELFASCEGRTAHKGARHGMKQNAKLQRVQEMEDRLLKEMAMANHKLARLTEVTNDCGDESSNQISESNIASAEKHKKHKKKKKKREKSFEECEENKEESIEEGDNLGEKYLKKKKKKRKHGDSEAVVLEHDVIEQVVCLEHEISAEETSEKPKKKKKKNKRQKLDESVS